MSVSCDWCAAHIRQDPADDFTAEELNRMGFEEGKPDDDRYVILEARYDGRNAHGYLLPRREVGHYHPECWTRTLALLADHRSWARGRRSGRVPSWAADGALEGDGLAATPIETAEQPPTAKPAESPDLIEVLKRRREGTPLDGLVSPRSAGGLRRAGVVTLEEVAQRTRFELLGIEWVGENRSRSWRTHSTPTG